MDGKDHSNEVLEEMRSLPLETSIILESSIIPFSVSSSTIPDWMDYEESHTFCVLVLQVQGQRAHLVMTLLLVSPKRVQSVMWQETRSMWVCLPWSHSSYTATNIQSRGLHPMALFIPAHLSNILSLNVLVGSLGDIWVIRLHFYKCDSSFLIKFAGAHLSALRVKT